MGDGLVSRVLRALRLDPTLYREVAAPGGSTEQAALVVVLAAAGYAYVAAAISIVSWLNFGEPGLTTIQSNAWIVAHFQNAAVVVRALAVLAAWPVWTIGMWLVAQRLTGQGRGLQNLGQVARALAFAQSPGIPGALLLVPVTVATAFAFPAIPANPDVLRDPVAIPWLGLLVYVGWGLVLIWVFLGTLLAVRESLGLSFGQAFGALVAVATGHAVLVALVLTIASVVAAAAGAIPDAFEPASTLTAYTDVTERVIVRVPHWATFGFDVYFGQFLSDALLHLLARLLVIV
ncbi:MAG: hypothetical protein OXG65_02170 [Chloroflexi bacterium]|nr:hypothetical protein [Chloroflexota bacterium]